MHHLANREGWLMQAAGLLSPRFAEIGYPLAAYRIGCGFPSHGALSRSNRVIGQCWGCQASADGTSEIFVSPVLHEPLDVLAVLAHELIHAAVGVQHGHKGPFVKVMAELGLEGKPTATVPGDAFKLWTAPILAELGPYPHAAFNPEARKKQSTRLLLLECDFCAEEGEPYKLRVSAKAVESHGEPICPVHSEPFRLS